MRPRHTILVVDDDPQFRELYRMTLRFEGFNVEAASDGLAALHAIDVHPPSLVILDLKMPCVDGWAVLRELEAHPQTRGLPVIVVTATDVEHATRQAVAILHKPITPEQVLPYIHEQLRYLHPSA